MIFRKNYQPQAQLPMPKYTNRDTQAANGIEEHGHRYSDFISGKLLKQ